MLDSLATDVSVDDEEVRGGLVTTSLTYSTNDVLVDTLSLFLLLFVFGVTSRKLSKV